MTYAPWDPKRGDPSIKFASLFDVFYDANHVGLGDGDTISGLADTSGNGRKPADSGLGFSTVTLNDPSVDFGSNNAGIANGNSAGVLWGTVAPEGTAAEVGQSRAIPALIPALAADPAQPVTFVFVAAFASFGLGTPFLPLNDAGTIDADGYVFGTTTDNPATGNWTSGTGNDELDSGIAADTDPHLFIVEWGTSASAIEVDGVLGDVGGPDGHVPNGWAFLGVYEMLFFAAKIGTLEERQRQLIRDWVNNQTPIVVA